MDPAALKQVKIQTGVVKRIMKEHACYTKEVEKELQKIEKMKSEAQNEDDEATEELRKLIKDCSLEECQELTEAKAQVEAASAVISS
ncbi:unnamed protein product [Angiostrongylus costaricensis]|uniref:Tubulin-specific chaperone A n=1 Tax=Angiostrongylus costaricensis TaxID=334426 RepID=A0A0R3PKW5_ANGCS|nr:unnamed protein product [Angiostrongylus costaricensis]